jgi:tripartite ATP-independent transporter DctM subunit
MFFFLGSSLGVVLMVVGVPIFVAFVLSGAIILFFDLQITWYAMGQAVFASVTKYILVAIPLFIFAGHLMLSGGIARRLIDLFVAFFGHFRGGLAIAAILSVAVFSAISGSILASIITIGTIMIPEMVRQGYSKGFSAALIAAVAGIDALIPPSNAAIVYCSITGNSVSDVFMAGMIPGLVQALLLFLVVIVLCRKMKPSTPASWRERGRTLYRASPALSLPIIILGGIYTGIFLPTEAAAVAGVCCLFIGFLVYRELTLSRVWKALIATAQASCIIFILIATASFLSQVMVYTRIPQHISEVIAGKGVSPITFMLLAGAVSLILGTFMEAVPNTLISMPIFMVIAKKLGVDLVHFYVPFCIFVNLGLLTPPVAVGAYTAASISEVSPDQIFRNLYPWMVLALLISGIINIFVPQLATWLPRTMH